MERGRPRRSNEARFQEKVLVAADGCWLWQGATDSRGYPRFKKREGDRLIQVRARRFAYEHHHQVSIDGLELDPAQCDNSLCVNPLHMLAVTHRSNMLRSNSPNMVASREHRCLRGHNLDLHGYTRPDGTRFCRVCARTRKRERRRDPVYHKHELILARARKARAAT